LGRQPRRRHADAHLQRDERDDRPLPGRSPTRVCLQGGEVWVAGAVVGGVLLYDPVGGRRGTVPLGAHPSALACGAGGVWALATGRLLRIDPESGTVRRAIDVGAGVSALAVGHRAVWVANPLTGIVARRSGARRRDGDLHARLG
jgi:streptogramin lyase